MLRVSASAVKKKFFMQVKIGVAMMKSREKLIQVRERECSVFLQNESPPPGHTLV